MDDRIYSEYTPDNLENFYNCTIDVLYGLSFKRGLNSRD